MLRFWWHGNCYDGHGAAWAAYKKFGTDGVVYQPVAYGKSVPEYNPEDEIYVVDFSYPREILLDLNEKVSKLVVLDHHVTAQKDLDGLDFCLFDMDRSGAGITWDYFHEGKPRPKMIDLIEDRDLWKFKYSETKRFHAYIRSFPFDFAVWDQIAKDVENEKTLEEIMTEGKAILRSADRTVEMMCDSSWVGELKGFEGIKAAIVNATCHWSEVGYHLLEKHPNEAFAVSFCHLNDGRIMWSLRGRGDFDVSAVAKAFGGGGHFSAAGAKTKTFEEVVV